MRILQLINNLGTGGAEKLLLETMPFYYERGIPVDLLVLDGTKHPFMLELDALNCCDVFTLGNGSVYNPMHIFKIIPYLKKYDIIHVHLFPSLYWVAMAKMIAFSNVKLVYTEHSTSNRRRHNFLLKIIDSFMYSFYDKIVCISEMVEDEIKKHVSMHDSTFVRINNGVNLSKIADAQPYSKAELSMPSDSKLLIQVSRFSNEKDQLTVIRAMKHLPENTHLLLVGDGERILENQNLAKALQVESRVHFLGIRMDVPRLLKSADIVILSSHHEGLSLSSIEGMASGKPFVATDVPGLTDVVFGAGVLFPYGDDKALANVLTKLDDKTYYDAVATNCLARAKQYNIDSMIDRHIDLYHAMNNKIERKTK